MEKPTGRNAQKRQRAEAYIQAKIAQLNAGEALPPIRQMIAESGLGRNVLENCINQLAALKILETRDRSGIYLTDCSGEESERIIDIVACSEIGYLSAAPNSYARELINTLLRRSAAHGYASRLLRVSYYAPLSEYQELIRKYKIRNAMLVMPHSNEVRRLFDTERVENTVILPRYYPSQGPAVIDTPELVKLQMEYLYRNGHRKIGFIHTVDLGFLSLTDLLRREDYYKFMSEHSLGVRPEWVVHYSVDETVLFSRLDRMMHSSMPPTALVVFDWFLEQVYRYCEARNLRISEDISIISSDGMEFNNLQPIPTTIINSADRAAELSWRLFLEHAADPRVNTIDYVDLEVRDGQSVRRLKP